MDAPREFMLQDESVAIRDRIVQEIQRMEEMPSHDIAVMDYDYRDEREAGFPPLVIRPGWQESYEEWSRRIHETPIEEWRNFEMHVGEDNMLLANGEPLVYDEREHILSLTTPDGCEAPLPLNEDDNVVVSVSAEIDEMIANGEAE